MRPTGRALLLVGVWVALALAAATRPALLGAWISFGGALLAVVLLDAIVLLRTPPPTCTRTATKAMALGEWHTVTLRLTSRSARPLRLQVTDHPPQSFECEGLERTLQLPGRGWLEIDYRARPSERGTKTFGHVDLLVPGLLGLLHRRVRVGQTQELRVYPDFRAVSKYALLALDNRLSQLGIHLRRRRGQGTEFFQLREYRQGDSLRQIDWKAVSRRRQLISREYRDEQNQRIVFVLDCGRRMRTRDGDMSHFDHALNAMLLLSYVALRQGDAVGLLTFSGDRQRWLPPVKGPASMTTILNNTFDLQPTTEPSDYAEAVKQIGLRQRRRSLVVLLTNLRDDDADDLPNAIAPIRRKHLVLLSSLREPVLERALQKPITEFEDALRIGALHGYLEQRRRVHEVVKGRGVLSLDTEPAELPVALVNKYLEIKRAGLL